MPDRNKAEYERTKDTDFAYEIPGAARFRCNYLCLVLTDGLRHVPVTQAVRRR